MKDKNTRTKILWSSKLLYAEINNKKISRTQFVFRTERKSNLYASTSIGGIGNLVFVGPLLDLGLSFLLPSISELCNILTSTLFEKSCSSYDISYHVPKVPKISDRIKETKKN